MQHDNYNNHQIDQQLRELEQYSLPDLSKQDDHWKSMSAMIGTSMMPPSQPGKGFFSRSIFKWITGVVLVGGATYLIYTITRNKGEETHRNKNVGTITEKESDRASKAIPPPADTAMVLPAKPLSDSVMPDVLRSRDVVYQSEDVKRDTIKKVITITSTKPNSHKVVTVKPIASNEKPKSDTLVTISSTTTPAPAPPKELNNFFAKLQKKPQQFQINNQRDTVLKGKEGTVLHIPKNSFNVNGDVIITITEFYSIEDMIMNKLSTITTDGRQLVSGGMVYITASGSVYSDSLLPLRNGVNWRMEMPKTTDSSMQLFYGRTSTNNELLNTDVKWEATGQQFQQPVTTLFDTTRKGNGTGGIAIPINDSVFFTAPERKGVLNKLFGRKTYRFTEKTLSNPDKRPPGTYDTIREGTPLISQKATTLQQNIKKADAVINDLYGVNISQLGWINCDRFLGTQLTTNFSVSLDTPIHYRTILVFDRIKSVMPGTYWEKDRSTFYNIPVGEKVKVICVGIDSGKTISAIKEFIVEANQKFDLTFEETDPATFAKQLQKPADQ